jgi:hypothetical protein
MIQSLEGSKPEYDAIGRDPSANSSETVNQGTMYRQ